MNANGLSGRDLLISSTLEDAEVDLVLITETRLASNRHLSFRQDCILSHNSQSREYFVRGAGGARTNGGIMAVARSRETAATIRNLYEEPGLTVLLIQDMIIGLIYSPPSDPDLKIIQLITKAIELAEDKQILIIGDLNARLGAFNGDHFQNSRGRLLLNEIIDGDLQYIHPTEGKYTSFSGTGAGITDILLTSSNCHIVSELIVTNNSMGGSDHRWMTFNINLEEEIAHNYEFQRPNIRLLQQPTIQKRLKEQLGYEMVIWETAADPELLTVNEMWSSWLETVKRIVVETVGVLTFKKQRQKVFSEELLEKQRELIQQAEILQILVQDRQQAPIIAAASARLSALNREFQAMLQKSSRKIFDEFTENFSSKQSSSALMKLLSCRRRRRERKKTTLDINKLDEYIGYYESTFGGDPMGEDTEQPDITTTDYFTFESMDILGILKDAALGKATGSDGVFGEVLHYGAPELAPSLTILFNHIEKTRSIPDQWKEAMICPVFKKGDKSLISNYRPIALTSVVRRAYEKLLAKMINEHVGKLQDEQGGFRVKRSTTMQVFALHEAIVNNPGLHLINLDFRAAYDLVDRRILWKLLSNRFNFQKNLVRSLKMLFDDNNSCLVLLSRKSRAIPNKRGLLQGSSLSPILFNFFIDEMLAELKACPHKVTTYGIRTNCLAFADDVNIHAMSRVEMVTLLKIVEDWSIKVGMRFAPQKCILINQTPITDFKIYGTVVSNEPSTPYLGIMINQSGIDWDGSSIKRTTKAQRAIGVFRDGGMNLGGFTPSASIQIFKAFIRPIYEYGMSLGVYKGEQLEQMQRVQNLGLRSIFSAARNTSIAAMHKLARIPMVKFRNQEIAARFGAQLHNNTCRKITAVRLWWNGLQTARPRSSLIQHTTVKNPLWHKQKKLNHYGLNLTNDQNPVLLPSTITKRAEWNAEHLAALETNPERIAGAIQTDRNDKLRSLLKPGIVTKKERIAIVKWILGGVATHQSTCKICDQELSRAHAIECAEVGQILLPKYEDIIDQELQLNMIDQVLNHYRNSIDPAVYKDIFQCVKRIYTRCLGYRQGENGHFVEAQERQRHRLRGEHVVNGWNRARPNIPQRRPRVEAEDNARRLRQCRRQDLEIRPVLADGNQEHPIVQHRNNVVIPARRRRSPELDNENGGRGQRWRPP